MTDGPIQVNPQDLFLYGGTLTTHVLKDLADYGNTVSSISQCMADAFATLPEGTHPFLEGMDAYRLVVSRNVKEFQGFVQDLQSGLAAMQAAATAIAVAYATTDSDSANSISMVDFAFGGGGAAPKGFPTDGVTTLADERAANAAASGQYTMAAQAAENPDAMQGVQSSYNLPDGSTIVIFTDGSMLQIKSTRGNDPFLPTNSKVMTVVDGGNVAQVITRTESEDYSGNRTTSTTRQTRQADGSYTTSGSAITNEVDGDLTVSTTTTDSQGKTQTSQVVVPNRAETTPAPSPDQGEIEKREQQYNSHAMYAPH